MQFCKTRPLLLGQPPDAALDIVAVNYAGPLYVKYGSVCTPGNIKALYQSKKNFVCRVKPSLIRSDHGTNFVSAA